MGGGANSKFSCSLGAIQTCPYRCLWSNHRSQWMKTGVCFFRGQIIQELTLCLVGTLKSQAGLSAEPWSNVSITPNPLSIPGEIGCETAESMEMNSESLQQRPPLINASQGDGEAMDGSQLHIVPATPISRRLPSTVPFINNPVESAFFSTSSPLSPLSPPYQ